MEYYVEQPKKIFSYTMSDGTVHTDVTKEYIDSLDLSNSDKTKLMKDYNKFNNQLDFFERKWRNKILSMTDWLMVEDATFNGIEIRDTNKFEDIKSYRKALRNYNPRTDDRPKRPEWLII